MRCGARSRGDRTSLQTRGAAVKALFLGGVAADTARGIEAQLPASLEAEIIDDPIDRARLPAAAAEADILVSNHWRADYPPAPKVRLVQSVATGVDLFDLAALPAGITVCNAFGHETAIAEYVVMAMLALHHRLFEIAGEFRDRASWRTSWVAERRAAWRSQGLDPGHRRLWPGRARGRAPCRTVRLPHPRRQPHPAASRRRRRAGLPARRARPDAAADATRWRCAPRSARRRPGSSTPAGSD